MDKKTAKTINRLNRCNIAARADEKGNIILPDLALPGELKQDSFKLPAKKMEKLLDEALILSVSMLEKGTFPLVLTALYYMRCAKDGDVK